MTDDVASGRGDREVTHPDVAIIDFSDLVARCTGNLAFAERILAKFEQRLEEDLVLLEKEVDQHDAAAVASVAHRLKGASANVSATRLSDVFARMERLGRTAQLQQVPECMDELRREWSRFKAQSPSFSPTVVADEVTITDEP
jgi:HPt (histidine-containing phosphotransfer) domain-containing protein